MEEYEGRAEIKNSSSTVDFGYYEFKVSAPNGGRIETGKKYITEFIRLDQFTLIIVVKEKEDCQGCKS